MVTQGHTEQAMRRLLDEYLAMPGLSLTVAQMRRLLALDAGACQELLAVLAQTGYLVRRADGRCVRPPDVELAAWRRAVQVVVGGTGGLGNVVAAPMSFERHRTDSHAGGSRPTIEIDRILCPVDFFPESMRALKRAVGIARRYAASITALHVLETAPGTGAGPADEAMLHRLRQFVAAADPGPVYIEAVVSRGSVISQVVGQAKRVAADLLVIGPGRWPDDERLPLGSVTQAVLLSAPCSVLVVPRFSGEALSSEAIAFSRILCAVDFSAASMRALGYASSLASQFRSRLRVLHVLDLAPLAREARAYPSDSGTSWRDLESSAMRHLHAAVPDDVRRLCDVDEVVAVGTAAREILHAANETSADLIVMGAQSRAGFELLRFGSTAHEVVREALCPVLTTRARDLHADGIGPCELENRAADAEAGLVSA